MLGDELQEQVSHFILDLYLYIHLYQYLYLYLYLHIYLYQYLYPSWCLATNYNGWSHQFNQPPRVDDIIWQNTKRQKYKPGDKLQEQFSPINLQEGGWYEIIEDDCCRQAKRTIRLRQFFCNCICICFCLCIFICICTFNRISICICIHICTLIWNDKMIVAGKPRGRSVWGSFLKEGGGAEGLWQQESGEYSPDPSYPKLIQIPCWRWCWCWFQIGIEIGIPIPCWCRCWCFQFPADIDADTVVFAVADVPSLWRLRFNFGHLWTLFNFVTLFKYVWNF